MPLILPGSAIVPRVEAHPLTSSPVPEGISFRYELLSRDENIVDTIRGVVGGELKWTSQTAVKGGGTIELSDIGQTFDWLQQRIRPIIIVEKEDGTVEETTLGIFLAATPLADWTDTGRSWEVDILDKASILDTDIVSNAAGDAVTYSLPKGTNVIDAIKALIVDTGESSAGIPPSDKTLFSDSTWPAGTTRLKIVNDLLHSGNFFSLSVDGQGFFRAIPYELPAERNVEYEVLAPFKSGPSSLMDPTWQHQNDIYDVPNRVVAIQMGDGTTEGLTAVATNTDPTSQFSYQARGRWVTAIHEDVEATDQDALDAFVKRSLRVTTNVKQRVHFKNLFLPDLAINSVIRFTAQDVDILSSVRSLLIPLDPLKMCETTVGQVSETGSDSREEEGEDDPDDGGGDGGGGNA